MAGGEEGMPAVQHARLAARPAAKRVRTRAPVAAASARSGEPGVAPPASPVTTFTLPSVQVQAHIQGQTAGFVPGATETFDFPAFVCRLGGFTKDFLKIRQLSSCTVVLYLACGMMKKNRGCVAKPCL